MQYNATINSLRYTYNGGTYTEINLKDLSVLKKKSSSY